MKIEDSDFNTGKRIAIELGTQLQIKIGGVDFNFKCSLIGIKPDKFLIINAPSPYGSIEHKLFRGNKIIVRYLYKGTVFGFQSELVEDIYAPLKLLFVKYPEIIEEHNLRSQERIDCFLPTKIKIKNEERNGVILNITEVGCFCVFKGAVKGKESLSVQIDEQVTLRCQFPEIGDEQVFSGKIKNITGDKKQMTLGILFHEIEPEIEDIIVQYILAIKKLPKSK
jgi:c-di-GMP-binding flagellar brake protein YcgR